MVEDFRDKTFFSEPNINNSYWAGFIAADGCIVGNRLVINLAVKDKDHLQVLATSLGTYLYEYTTKQYSCVRLAMRSMQIAEDLYNNYNITSKKSMTLQPPNITDEKQIQAFIAGYFDGDGSLYYFQNRGYTYPAIEILGTDTMLKWIDSIYRTYTGSDHFFFPKRDKIPTIRKTGNKGVSLFMNMIKTDVQLGRKRLYDSIVSR